MGDVGVMRDAVIAAARLASSDWHEDRDALAALDRLRDAIAELDAALKPDPWELLKRIREHDIDPDEYSASDLNFEIDAALAWHKEHGNT